MIITHPLNDHRGSRRSDQIVAINGVPVRSIWDSLLTVGRSNGNHATGKKYINMKEILVEARATPCLIYTCPCFFSVPEP